VKRSALGANRKMYLSFCGCGQDLSQFGRQALKFAQKRGWQFYWCPAGSN
jgi:hypothetical protein